MQGLTEIENPRVTTASDSLPDGSARGYSKLLSISGVPGRIRSVRKSQCATGLDFVFRTRGRVRRNKDVALLPWLHQSMGGRKRRRG